LRLDQGQQRRPQPWINSSQPLASTAHPACPAEWLLPRLQLGHTPRHRGFTNPSRPRDQPAPAMAQHPGLSSQQQAPLPLIQVRQQRLELRRQRFLSHHKLAHATRPRGNHQRYGLFHDSP
jgi:hypothetical protein